MRAFVGDAAREPGDLDWVVVPETIRMDQPPAHEIIDGIIKAVAKDPVCKDATIDAAEITQVDIWTYDRAPGRRLAFPWRCADLPPAVIQMDFVFEQRLRSEPHEVTIELGLLSTLSAMSASREESLAWKLLWLHSDIHPQGKDLYDAVLLAEGSTVPALLLKNVFEDADQLKHLNGARGFPFEADPAARVDWENFVKECPWVSGTVDDCTTRLTHAIRPMFYELQQ